MPELPPLEELLACPVDKTPLWRDGAEWISGAGRRYPEIKGVPVLLRPDSSNTIGAMEHSRHFHSDDAWQINSLDMDQEDRARLRAETQAATQAATSGAVDPVVRWMVAATCGNLYRGLVGRLKRYPIPEMRLKNGAGRLLVDVGCNWGRWCLAAAREGFIPVGIDPQLGAVLAAKRVAEQHGVKARFICADARHLPLREGVADVVFSYSVIQHLSREDATEVIDDARRILKANGRLYVQMPNVLGLRCLFQWAKRGFTDGAGFEVRYWTPGQLTRAFGRIGPVRLETDCFFGIGLQPADADLMPGSTRRLLKASERLRAAGFPTTLADSVYVNAVRQS